jgi:hypothetical protein
VPDGGRPSGVGGSTAVGEALRVKEPCSPNSFELFGVRLNVRLGRTGTPAGLTPVHASGGRQPPTPNRARWGKARGTQYPTPIHYRA